MSKIKSYKNIESYYKFECDDIRKDKDIPTDISFDLTKLSDLELLTSKCDELGLSYCVYYEVWRHSTEQMLAKEFILDTRNEIKQRLKLCR